MANKRYYWLKLKEDFFSEKYVKALRRLPQGDSLVIVYLKMQLKSLKTEGVINYEGILPNSIAELAMAIDEDENIVRLAVEALIRFGTIEKWENDTLYMVAMQELVGSETAAAERVRKHRALHGNTKALLCNSNVTKCNTEIDIEKDIEKEIEKEIEKRDREKVKEKPKKHQYGEYKNVLLSDTEYEKLINEFPEDYQERIERLSEYIASTGKKYKNFLATIRSWAKKENQTQRNGKNEINSRDIKRDGSEYSMFD